MHLLAFWPTVNSQEEKVRELKWHWQAYIVFVGVCKLKQMKCISGAAPATGA